ncbi:hypothetical protein Gxy13693_023_012 [Komagataeibacter xylinus NBRC 13693]|uniref:Uncharacterized protein n=1 Tax=Komagataeibacter xylinus NBRC 13693 TaxID=1234668 RepID=A0A0D6Q987_KOMXY|nr:hypothetical protein Gxy13693_023_012 [Komagataeibacter xylinus NBRC 13693]
MHDIGSDMANAVAMPDDFVGGRRQAVSRPGTANHGRFITISGMRQGGVEDAYTWAAVHAMGGAYRAGWLNPDLGDR